jgi:4-azaleucine resistance transporter AzlC
MTSQDFAREFRAALRHCGPFIASVIPMGMIFGALAVAAGLSAVEAIAMSGLVYSGAAQFTGLQLAASGAGLPVIVLVTLLLSLRLLLYGLALVEDVRSMPAGLKAILAFGLVDAVFFIVKARFAEGLSEGRKRAFFLACVLLVYFSWLIGTALGVAIGDRLAVMGRDLGLDFLAYACFAGLLAPYLRLSGAGLAAALAVAGMIAFRDLPYNLGLLASCLFAVASVMGARRLVKATRQARS